MKPLVALFAAVGLVGCSSTSRLEVVSDFERSRYLGTWYEAARYPHRFEKNLSSVSAEYSLNEDGTIKVLNRGYNDKKKAWKTIEGVARMKDEPGRGWLKVSFFRPFYASYKIIHLNEDYTQAIVTGPSYDYLWILARDPALPRAELDQLIQKIREFGFAPDNLLIIDQSRNQ
jgi:apolipoprotein D and lipocalin family protein